MCCASHANLPDRWNPARRDGNSGLAGAFQNQFPIGREGELAKLQLLGLKLLAVPVQGIKEGLVRGGIDFHVFKQETPHVPTFTSSRFIRLAIHHERDGLKSTLVAVC